MFTQFIRHFLLCLTATLLLALPTGCSEEEASPGATRETAKSVEDDAATHAELAAKLAAADRLDGKADKIVARCASCGFKMEGKPDHSLKVLDYTLYFCREACAQSFAKNLTESVMAMRIPESLPEPGSEEEDKEDAGVQARIMAKLAAADLLDGKADKTVVRCAGCALGMDGSPDHALESHGYTLYFCKAECAERFSENIDASILSMEIPED